MSQPLSWWRVLSVSNAQNHCKYLTIDRLFGTLVSRLDRVVAGSTGQPSVNDKARLHTREPISSLSIVTHFVFGLGATAAAAEPVANAVISELLEKDGG